MQIGYGLFIAWLSLFWVVVEALFADRNCMLTAQQMLAKYPAHPQGLPIIWHGGIWGDIFIITSILFVIVALYSEQWSLLQMGIMLGIGMVLSIGMHLIYLMTPFPDSLAWKGGLSIAGFLHLLYMGWVLAIIGLFLFCSHDVSPRVLIIIGIALTVHMAIGNHLLLGWFNLKFRFPWCPDFLGKPDPWITVGAVNAILAGIIWWKTGDWHPPLAMMLVSWFIIVIPIGVDGLASMGRAGIH